MRIEILDESGDVINTINAQPEFAQAQHPGRWRLAADQSLPDPAVEKVHSCTRRQGRLALLKLDLFDGAESAIAAMPDGSEKLAAQIEYEADTWERGNPFLSALWSQLGGTPEGLDEAFALAVTL